VATPARASWRALRLTVLIAALAALAGCGASLKGDPAARASVDPDPPTCPQTVMSTLGSVLSRVYHEGVFSERTASAQHLIERSLPLRTAIEDGNASAATAAAHELLATGHMTNLRVTVGAKTLTSVGGAALAPFGGTIENAAGKPIATYLTSVWADSGFASEGSGVAEGLVAVRAGGRSIGGSIYLPAGRLADEGSVTRRGVVYQYTSMAGEAYPSGAVRIYLLKPLSAIEALCGSSSEATVVNTLAQVANLIYEGEAGPRTLVQIHRVQKNGALLSAVARRDPVATSEAVAALLHHHLVRLRVSAQGKLLDDLGGPFVLAPVHAPLKLNGHKIGDITLSIQDDEGYLRLTHRLAGLDVLMYMAPAPGSTQPRLVKNSLGPNPGTVPASGPFTYKGHSFQVFTVHAEAFPSGPLTIRVLVPIPYS
jgi:hypothetical protein